MRKYTNIWPRASVEGPLWNIKVTPLLVFAIYIYIYVEYRVAYEAQNCFKNAYIYIWGISCCISNSINFTETHIYMRNIVLHIQIAYGVLKKTQNFIFRDHIYIYEEYRVAYPSFAKSWNIHHFRRLGVPKAETFTILQGPMFAKGLQKSSKHAQPRNSSVEYLWNIKKCSFEGFRSPGGSCLKACGCHVGGWFV